MVALPKEGNPALTVDSEHNVYVTDGKVGTPKKGEVLIHVRACGICGSDVHFWHMGQIGDMMLETPCVMGHEAAGEVIELGEGVTDYKVGDRVAIEPQLPCGKCYLCMQGDYNLCQEVEFSSVWPYDGFMQRYKTHSARFIHKIPDSMTFAQGALVEPVAVAYHGIERSELSIGKGALIIGAGPIGLCTLALAKASGATPLVINDISKERLDFAKKMFPSVITYQSDLKKTNQENAIEIRKLFGPTEYDQPPCVLECTGVEAGIVVGAYVTRRAGTLTVIGVGKGDINNFPFMKLSLAEIDVKFINRYHDAWPPCIRLIADKVIDVDALVTHVFPFEKADDAMRTSADPSNGNIKVMLQDN
ncbi:unnamed protein product [Ambrosiozyma monospora]|uniref:Unnamed protein product n=1 Tax=Ambrosiozyma monospora TaxID=43982 RepID=A0A9W6Z0H3_AMBMO|nr:unnamed protein product [Ambrosiozyma monospora]